MFSSTHVSARGAGRRTRAVITTAAVLVGAAAFAAPAGANLASFTPGAPGELPFAYSDGATSLAFCPEGDPNCISADGEGFYFSARSDKIPLSASGGTAELRYAVESVDDPGPNVFSRVRVKILGGRPNTTYHVTHPFGALDVTTDRAGLVIDTVDTGCLAGTVPPCDYSLALRTAIGPFLTWDTLADRPAGYIGDPNVLHTVTGGLPTEAHPEGVNSFFVTDGAGDTADSDEFFVQGKIAGDPAPVFSAAGVNVGAVDVGASKTATVTIRNLGAPGATSDLTINSVAAPGGSAFTVGATTCAGVTLASGQSCTVDVTFAPSGAGAQSTALAVDTSAGAKSVALSGTGVAVPVFSAAAVEFGAVDVGASSTATVTIRNDGVPGPTSGLAITSISAPSGGQFAVGADTCTGVTLASGETCTADVTFAPSSAAAKTGALTVRTNAGTKSVALSGSGVAVPVFSAAAVDFGAVDVGASNTATVTIRNAGVPGPGSDLTITSIAGPNGAQFRLGGETCAGVTLTSGSSCTVEVTFAPTGSGAKTGALTVDTSAGRKSVALSGAGVTPAPRDGAGQQPPVVNHTVIQLVPGSGSAAGSAPAAPAQAVSPASARALTVAGLGVAPRISVTRLRAHGVRADMRVAPGTNVVRIAIYRARGGRRTGRALYVTHRVPLETGPMRVTLRGSGLLRKLRAGSYVMEVRAGRSVSSLGAVRRVGFRVTR